MIQELDDVILNYDLPQYGLKEGDIGTAVLVHNDGEGYEVEFTSLDGETLAIVTLKASQARSVHQHEIAHARELVSA